MRMRGLIAGVLLACLGTADTQARVGPGALLPEMGCTSNFVFRDATDVYLGTAAHCFIPPVDATECADPSFPLGHPVVVEGATRPLRLAYSSFLAMNAAGESDPDVCLENDFALMRIDPADHASVDPSMPVFGGPTGVRRGAIAAHETMVSFGRSIHREAVEALRPREGYVTGTAPGGWTVLGVFPNPVIFGDSGSGVLDGAGGALGVVVRAGGVYFEDPGASGTAAMTPLEAALDYMRKHGGPDVRLVSGSAPFAGASIPELVSSPPSQADPAPAPVPAPASQAPAPPPATQPAAASEPAPAAKRKRAKRSCRKARGRKAKKRCARRQRRR